MKSGDILGAIAQNTVFADDHIYFNAVSHTQARQLLIQHEATFASWAKAMQKNSMVIKSPDGGDISIPSAIASATQTITVPDPSPENLLWFANVAVSPALLKLANDLMENPRKAGVTRVSDELQVIMSDACKVLNPGHTLQEATTWTRSQFWHPQDLIDFRRECQQNLNPDGSNILEFSWASFDPELGMSDRTSGNWLKFTTRYRLFDGGDGDFYQLCENLDMEEMKILPTI